MNLTDITKILEHLIPVSKQAGDIILRHIEQGFEPIIKQDGSPVTLADQEAEAHIIKALEKLEVGYPIIGEELAAAGLAPKPDQDGYWLIDALDGTRGFIKGKPDFTVNIAFVKQGAPILGLVYAPVLNMLYVGGAGLGALKGHIGSDLSNMQKISCRKVPSTGITVTLNSDRAKTERIESMLPGLKVEGVLKKASSLKFCLIAEGQADLYPRFGETSEWDTAAGQAILEAAGGQIYNFTANTSLLYGDKQGHYNNPHFVALSDDLFQYWKHER